MSLAESTNFFKKGEQLLMEGNVQDSQDFFNQAINCDPKDKNSYLNQGKAYFQKEMFQMAVQVYETAIKHIKDWELYYYLGYSYVQLKKYEIAIDNFDESIELKSDYSNSYNWKGYCLKWLKKYEEALVNYDLSLKYNPSNYETYSNKGNTLRKLGRHQESIECYDEAIKLNQNFPFAYNGKGNVYFEQDRLDQALELFSKAIKLYPKFHNPYTGMGNIYRFKEEYEKAMECYNRALELKPTFTYAWNGKGNAYIDMEQYREALDCYNKALQIDPQYSNGYIGKGTSLKKLGFYFEAILCYTSALQYDQNNLLAYCYRGALLMNVDPNQARADLEQAAHLLQNPKVASHMSQVSIHNTAETISKLLSIQKQKQQIDVHIETNKDNIDKDPKLQRYAQDYLMLKEKTLKTINDHFEDKCQNGEIGRVSIDEIINELDTIDNQYKKIMEELTKQGKQIMKQSEAIKQHDDQIKEIYEISISSGIQERSQLRNLIQALRQEDINYNEYYRAFYWTLFNYLMSYKMASTGLLQTNQDEVMKDKEKFIYQVGKKALDLSTKAFPILSEIGGLINGLIDSIYGEVRAFRFEKKLNIINRVVNLKTVSLEDLDVQISRAAVNITIRKKKEIIEIVYSKEPKKKQSFLDGIKQKILGKKVDLYESEAGQLALKDVIAFLGYLYINYEMILPERNNDTSPLNSALTKSPMSGLRSSEKSISLAEQTLDSRNYKQLIREIKDIESNMFDLTLSELIEEIIMTQKAEKLLNSKIQEDLRNEQAQQDGGCCKLF